MEDSYYAALESMNDARNAMEAAIERVKSIHRNILKERDKRIDELEHKIKELEKQFSGN